MESDKSDKSDTYKKEQAWKDIFKRIADNVKKIKESYAQSEIVRSQFTKQIDAHQHCFKYCLDFYKAHSKDRKLLKLMHELADNLRGLLLTHRNFIQVKSNSLEQDLQKLINGMEKVGIEKADQAGLNELTILEQQSQDIIKTFTDGGGLAGEIKSANISINKAMTLYWPFLAELNAIKAKEKIKTEDIELKKIKIKKILDRLKKPTAIDIDTIELVHGIERQQDGYISFCRRVNKEHQDLAGIKLGELRQYLPQILPFLLQDSFFSVNASYRAAPYIAKDAAGKEITGLPSPWRKEVRLRYLNACYCDMDCYKTGLKWADGVREILQAQDDNIIPPASIIGRSGRGLYLLWLLTSERQGAQQRAFPQEIELYKQINKAIGWKLNKYQPRLAVDKNAHDAARILRVPGSVNTKIEGKKNQVIFQIQITSGGRVPVYTLKDLAKELDIPIMPFTSDMELSLPHLKPIISRGSAPARRQGKIATGQYRLNDLLTIAQYQSGFKKGKRWKSISYYCYFAKAAGYTLSDIQAQARQLAEQCRPAYPSEKNDTPVDKIVKDIWIKYTPQFNSDYLANFFDITPELAEELSLKSIIPAQTREQRKNQPSKQKAEQIKRRDIINQVVSKRPGNIPSLRKLQAILESKGVIAGLMTIRRDLAAIKKLLSESVSFSLPYRGGGEERGDVRE